jgi:hypothetical protein
VLTAILTLQLTGQPITGRGYDFDRSFSTDLMMVSKKNGSNLDSPSPSRVVAVVRELIRNSRHRNCVDV